MPIVHAYIGEDPQSVLVKAQRLDDFIEALFRASQEIIPAALNSPERPINPGEIDFIALPVSHKGLTSDVLIEVEALDFPDRRLGLNNSCHLIQVSLESLFRGKTFSVWGKLVHAGSAGENSTEKYRGDMSLKAAIQRAREAMGPTFTSD